MTGKELLDDYKDFGKIKGESISSNHTCVPSDYIMNRKKAQNLEDELTKYKRAFEILKEKGIFEFKDYTNMIFLKPEDYIWNGDIIEEMFINVNDDEYELLEELIGNDR